VAVQAGPARYLAKANGVGGRLELGSISLPLDLRGTVPLAYYGPAGSIPTFSAASVSQADLRGKIVFLGATAPASATGTPRRSTRRCPASRCMRPSPPTC